MCRDEYLNLCGGGVRDVLCEVRQCDRNECIC